MNKGVIFIEGEYVQEGNEKVKYEFTYLDYLYYCDRQAWENIVNGEYLLNNEEDNTLCIKEDTTEYVTTESKQEEKSKQSEKTGDKKHDKIFKDILQNKEEIAHFISQFVEYQVKAQELEIYNANYITKKFEYKNADIVYKIKGKELYFLIEHQTKVDYSMSYRIFNYSLEIIRSVVQGKEINRITYRYPRIVPIVLYTGNQKLKENTMLTNVMMLEKCKNNKEVLTYLSKIRKNTNDNKQLQELKRIVSYLYENEDEKTIEEIVKILEESESEESMSTIAERIGRELASEKREARVEGINIGINQGINKGILQAVKQIVEQMIKMNFEDATIKQVTGAKDSEIEKIRKEMSKNQ